MTILIAVYAAILSTLSLGLSILAFRAGGPVVDLSFEDVGPAYRDVPAAEETSSRMILGWIHVVNRGRSAITIDSVRIDAVVRFPVGPRRFDNIEDRYECSRTGPKLPHRLEGYSTVRWMIELEYGQRGAGKAESVLLDAHVAAGGKHYPHSIRL